MNSYRYIGDRPRKLTNPQIVLKGRGLIANTPTGPTTGNYYALAAGVFGLVTFGAFLAWHWSI